MDSVADHRSGGHTEDTGLADVSEMKLAELLAGKDTALARAVRRLVEERISTEVTIAGFGNTTPEETSR